MIISLCNDKGSSTNVVDDTVGGDNRSTYDESKAENSDKNINSDASLTNLEVKAKEQLLKTHLELLPLTHRINGKSFIIDWDDKLRALYSQQFMRAKKPLIPPDRLFVSPAYLSLLSDITEKVVSILDQIEVTYWAIAGSQLSALRFASFMPWDDDADLAVMIDELIDKKTAFMAALEQNRLILKWDICFKEYPHNSHCKVSFSHDELVRSLSDLQPEMSKEEVENLAKNTHIDVDLFPFGINQGRYIHTDPIWQKSYKNSFGSDSGYAYSDIYPLKRLPLNNFYINTMNNMESDNQVWYKSDNILYNFSMSNAHSNSGFKPLIIDNIKDYPAFLELIDNYLRFTFEEKYQDMPEPLSDILEEYQGSK